MSVKCLSDSQQSEIVRFTLNNTYNQTELAELFGKSRRTIQRVLLEHGLLHYNNQSNQSNDPVHQPHNIKMLNMLRDQGHTPTTLQHLMDKPNLNHRNVALFLSRLPDNDLVKVIDTVTETRKYRSNRLLKEQQGKVAANG